MVLPCWVSPSSEEVKLWTEDKRRWLISYCWNHGMSITRWEELVLTPWKQKDGCSTRLGWNKTPRARWFVIWGGGVNVILMVINHDPHSCHSCHMISLSWTLHRAESSPCFSPRCAQSARGSDPSAASTAAAAAAASGEERRGERLQSVGPALRGAVFTGHNSGQHLRTQWVLFIKVWVRI